MSYVTLSLYSSRQFIPAAPALIAYAGARCLGIKINISWGKIAFVQSSGVVGFRLFNLSASMSTFSKASSDSDEQGTEEESGFF
jgi:hypothetical protein